MDLQPLYSIWVTGVVRLGCDERALSLPAWRAKGHPGNALARSDRPRPERKSAEFAVSGAGILSAAVAVCECGVPCLTIAAHSSPTSEPTARRPDGTRL